MTRSSRFSTKAAVVKDDDLDPRRARHLPQRQPTRLHGRHGRRDAGGADRIASRCSARPGRAKHGAEEATADAVIVLWMAGGMAQTETFDPKRYTPFEPGVPAEKVLTTFPAIDTAVDNIKFTAGTGADRPRSSIAAR